MKYIVALLVALMALTGMTMAVPTSAPTTSGTLPANVLNFTDTYTPTMVGYFGLLAMPLDFGVPSSDPFGTEFDGNFEGFDRLAGEPGNTRGDFYTSSPASDVPMVP
jgi:hypothetical protein